MIVFDTDILSMFAKIDAVDLLKHIFDEKAVITPKIRDEISVPLEYGYTFPLKVISTIRTVPLSNEALEEAREFAKREGVSVISLQAILKALWKKKIKSKEEVKQILERIKEADNLEVSREVKREIFEE